MRSGSRPKPGGSRPFASGQWAAISPRPPCRTRSPRPSSTAAPAREADERRDGARRRAPRRRASARAPRRRGRTRRRPSRSRRRPRRCPRANGSRTVRKSADSSVGSAPACARAKIAAAGSRPQLLDRELRVVEREQLAGRAPRRSSGRAAGTRTAPAGPGAPCSSKANGTRRPRSTRGRGRRTRRDRSAERAA